MILMPMAVALLLTMVGKESLVGKRKGKRKMALHDFAK
jgi:hypothetical protein